MWAVGIDLGGTNVRAAGVTDQGAVERFTMHPVDRSLDGEGHAQVLARLVKAAGGGERPAAAGVAVPATLQAPDGRILPGTSNLKGLEEFPLVHRLEELTGLPCAVGNDADMIMWGEAQYGAARGFRNAVALTLGTGIGSGLMLDGRLWGGTHGHGAEAGFTRVPRFSAVDGRRWVALEELASAEAFRNVAGAAAEEIFARDAAGDTTARGQVETVCEYLAVAIINIHLLLDLELVLLCGGMARSGSRVLEGVRGKFLEICPPPYHQGLTIQLGSLGDRAGVIGAARLAFSLVKKGS